MLYNAGRSIIKLKFGSLRKMKVIISAIILTNTRRRQILFPFFPPAPENEILITSVRLLKL